MEQRAGLGAMAIGVAMAIGCLLATVVFPALVSILSKTGNGGW